MFELSRTSSLRRAAESSALALMSALALAPLSAARQKPMEPVGPLNPPADAPPPGLGGPVPPLDVPLGPPEVVGPWTIVRAPVSATLVAGGGGTWDWLHVLREAVTLDEAFTGFNLIADGFANGPAGTTVELSFEPPVVNGAGAELVLLDGRFSQNSYRVSGSHDGFVDGHAVPFSSLQYTGVVRHYFYGNPHGKFFEALLHAAPIDLSTLGVPAGGAVGVLRVEITSNEGDFIGLGVGSTSCVALDFETEDDRTTPLANGQQIDDEFGALVTITSSGPNAGLAIFDTTPGGPNDPSQDPDLLVDRGHALILQTENLPPDAGSFPRPNDDEDGGTVTFEFAQPVRAELLRLIDVDAGDGTSTVTLTDSLGRQRVHTVPANWTGDRALGQPGEGVLDFAVEGPQAGFGSSATSSETPGFARDAVVRIEVVLDGSGALDDLTFCLSDAPLASVAVRAGSAESAPILSSSARPLLGGEWTAELDCAAFGRGTATLHGRLGRASGATSPFGEVLISGELVFRESALFSDAASAFAWPVPRDPSLAGLAVSFQGTCRESPAPGGKLREVRGGLSNALDLVLGF